MGNQRTFSVVSSTNIIWKLATRAIPSSISANSQKQRNEHHTQVIPLRASLPEKCYSVLKSTGDIIILKKGEFGYYRTEIGQGTPEQNRELVETQNRNLGVTKAQAAAMSAGSMYEWHTPAADPVNYDAEGHLLKPHNRAGGAR